MKHGEEKNRRIEKTAASFQGTTGAGDVTITFIDHELTVSEKWCAHCQQWTSTKGNGLLGHVVAPCCGNKW